MSTTIEMTPTNAASFEFNQPTAAVAEPEAAPDARAMMTALTDRHAEQRMTQTALGLAIGYGVGDVNRVLKGKQKMRDQAALARLVALYKSRTTADLEPSAASFESVSTEPDLDDIGPEQEAVAPFFQKIANDPDPSGESIESAPTDTAPQPPKPPADAFVEAIESDTTCEVDAGVEDTERANLAGFKVMPIKAHREPRIGGDLDRIRDALSFVPSDDRDIWLKMGMAIKSEIGETGRDIWDNWSQGSDAYTPADARDVWKSIKANGGIKIATLFHEAKMNGWRDDREPPPPPTPAELAESKRIADEQAAKDQAKADAIKAATAKKAAAILAAATAVQPDHPYLTRKGVASVETLAEIDANQAAAILGYPPQAGRDRLTGRLLVAPITRDGQITSLELIDGGGHKAALQGQGTKGGGYWLAQPLPEGDGECLTMMISEGVATTLSAKEATGYTAIAALSLSNFPNVLKAMRAIYPKAALLLLADLDKKTGKPDPKAASAATSVGAVLIAPDFGPDRPEDATDFNDLHHAQGLEAVRMQIETVIAAPKTELDQAKALILSAIERQADDAGAVFEDDIADAWNLVVDRSQADFQRLRKLAKDAGASVTEIDKACFIRNKRVSAKPNAKNYSSNNPSDPSGIRGESFLEPSGNLPGSEGWKPGYLIEWSDKNEPSRLIDSLAAECVASFLRERLAWDGEASTWHIWRKTHWAALVVASKAESLLADAVHIGTDPIGYRLAYLNGITQIIQRRELLHPPQHPANVIPFRNGLLDLATGTLTKATPQNAMDWALPHDYLPDADCPTIKAWLLRSVEDDQETVELLRAWLAALIRGLPLQYFLMLLGRGGSGKGTFQRLAMALIGAHNAAISTLRDLEENRFETAKLYGKRLCMVNEAGRHGGALNMLKAITGGDHLPLERKHQQQSGSFLFSGLVLMATNEDLQSTDATSGLERRRITVRFPRSATPEEIADWDAKGGEKAVLHAEIPGLINWLLAMPEAEIKARIGSPPLRVATDNMLGMAAGNSVADWMLSNTTPDPDAWTQIGVKKEGREQHTGQTYFENADEWLYANYLAWCLESGRSRPVALRKFRDTVADMAETLGCPVHQGRHPQSRAYSIKGLRFVRKDDPSESKDRWKAKGMMDAAFRKDRKDGRQNFSSENPPHENNDGDMGTVEGEL